MDDEIVYVLDDVLKVSWSAQSPPIFKRIAPKMDAFRLLAVGWAAKPSHSRFSSFAGVHSRWLGRECEQGRVERHPRR